MNKNKDYFKILFNKASKSICHTRISALGISKKGEILGCAVNRPRFSKYGGGIHAEMALMSRYKDNIKTIVILRLSEANTVRPVHPCQRCQAKADEMNIKIISLSNIILEI